MLKKVVSYPRWVGPVRVCKEMCRIGAEMKALPGYNELQRENMRYTVMMLVYVVGFLAVAMGLSIFLDYMNWQLINN